MKILFVISFIALLHGLQAVYWNGNNWALMCDFPGNDLSNAIIAGEHCGALCGNTPSCTHFAHTSMNGGTCWMKQGPINKANAIDSSDPSSSCGIIRETTNPITAGTTNKPATGVVTDSQALAKFTSCKFSYGADYVGDNFDYTPYDYVTIWIDTPAQDCGNSPSCTDFNEYYQGAMLKKMKSINKIPVFYGYVIAFEARTAWGLKDCNMGYPNLCQRGCKYIRENRDRIIERYDHHSQNIARIMGRDNFNVWLLEPDFWQFYGDHHSQEGGTLSGEEMRSLFDDIVTAIKNNLPQAAISWDISPWIGDDGMRKWWSYFSSSPHIDFIHTSGGGAHGESEFMQPGQASWRFMNNLTGKKIIADSGYGVGGAADNNREPWYQQYNINNRINDGVVSVSLANSKTAPTYKPNVC